MATSQCGGGAQTTTEFDLGGTLIWSCCAILNRGVALILAVSAAFGGIWFQGFDAC